MKITNPIFLNAAGRGGKKTENTIRFITTTSDPSVNEISCDGDIIVNSVKNGEAVSQTYSNLTKTQLSIQADANTEVVIIGNVTAFNSGAYSGWGYKDTVLASSIIFDCKTLNSISGLSGIGNYGASTVLLSISVVGCGKSLQQLDCSRSGVTALDLSKNTALVELNCENCDSLTSLDLSKNTALTDLECGYCDSLTSLDLSKNTALIDLNCPSCTGLTSLDLSANTALIELYCPNCTGLTALDLSKNTALTNLYCSGCTGLTALDLSNNTALTNLVYNDCKGLTALDLSNNTALINLNCAYIPGLTALDLSKNTALIELRCTDCSGLTALDLSTNTALTNLYCSGCVALDSIKYAASNSSVSTEIANLITANEALDGTVYTNSAGEYYSTIADAATAAGWTIAQL